MISIDFSVVFWTVFNFALLMLLLNRFLFKPLRTFMKKRQARIDAGLQARRHAQAQQTLEAERLRAVHSDRVQEELALTRDAVTRHREEARLRREQAEDNAALAREAAKTALRREQESLLGRLSGRMSDLTGALAGELLMPVDFDVPPAAPRQGEQQKKRQETAPATQAPLPAEMTDSILPSVRRGLVGAEQALANELLEPVT